MEQKVRIIVTTDRSLDIHEIASKLGMANVDVHYIYRQIGSISGAAFPSKFAELEKIPGVRAVELDRMKSALE